MWQERTATTGEVTWMAVDRDRHHGAIGTAIVEALCEDVRSHGYSFALALTSARPKGFNCRGYLRADTALLDRAASFR